MNVALYSGGGKRWAMTERGGRRLHHDAEFLAIGPSSLRWSDNFLDIRIDETCAPIPHRIQGSIRLFPSSICQQSFGLDADGHHQWRPFAPCSRVEVALAHPRLQWSGSGYLDSNVGARPLETDFKRWHWSRSIGLQRCVIFYDVETRDRARRSLALSVGADGDVAHFEAPPMAALPSTRWRVARRTRADTASAPRVRKTLEDSPFYGRSLLETRVLGSITPAIHESLDLDRFSSRWVQCLLPFRMPRLS